MRPNGSHVRQQCHKHFVACAIIEAHSSVSFHLGWWLVHSEPMMTSPNWNFFRVTGLLCGENTGHWWIPLSKASDAELWCFPWSAPWVNGWVNKTILRLLIWDAIALIIWSLLCSEVIVGLYSLTARESNHQISRSIGSEGSGVEILALL